MKDRLIKQSLALFFIFFVALYHGAAQSMKEKKTYLVHVSEKEYTVVAEILSKPKSTQHVHPDKEYFWYKSNDIMSTRGGYDGKLLHGKYSSFYLNSNLKEKGKFDMGLKDGEWIKWNSDGTIAEISHWKNGLKNGKLQTFNTKQELIMSSQYSRDKLNGEVITYEAGKIIGTKKYKNGVEVAAAENTAKKKEEKPLVKNPEPEKVKETGTKQDTTQNKKIQEKKTERPKIEQQKKKK